MPPTSPSQLCTRRRMLSLLALSAAVFSAASLPAAAAAATPVPLGRAASAPAELELTFEESAIVASGLTPGGEALVFTVYREPALYFTRVGRRDEVLAVDGLGELRYEPFEDGSALPFQAVWVVVDLASGKLAHGPTPGFETPVRPLPADGVRRGSGGRWSRLASELDEAHVLLVRPESPGTPGGAPAGPPGVWVGLVSDGGSLDGDGAGDGALEAAVEALVPLPGGLPAPEELAPGDLVVLVDPSDLAYFLVRLTPGALKEISR